MDGRVGRQPVNIDDHRGPTRERVERSAGEADPGPCIVLPKGGATKIDMFPPVTEMHPSFPGDRNRRTDTSFLCRLGRW